VTYHVIGHFQAADILNHENRRNGEELLPFLLELLHTLDV